MPNQQEGVLERIEGMLRRMLEIYEETQRQVRLQLYRAEACEQCLRLVDQGWIPSQYFQGQRAASQQRCPACGKGYSLDYDEQRRW